MNTQTLDATNQAATLHHESIVIDACAPILTDLDLAPLWLAGGGTCAMITVALHDDTMTATMAKIAGILRQASFRDDIVLVRSADDIVRAKTEGKFAVVLMFQSGRALEKRIDSIALYRQLGVRSINLAYNVAEDGADGCMEPRNGGLTHFGRQVIEEIERLGMVLDLSHTSYRASMEALEMAQGPVIFSHSNAAAIFAHPRNITDDQITACVATNGVIGLNGHPVFVKAGTTRPGIEDLMAQLVYLVEKAGIDHIGLGLDFSQRPGMQMTATRYNQMMSEGVWTGETLPPPPWGYPVEDASHLSLLTENMLRLGWSDDDVRKVLGLNFLRVFRTVWRDDSERES